MSVFHEVEIIFSFQKMLLRKHTISLYSPSFYSQRTMEEKGKHLKVFLVDVVTKDTNAELLADRMRELENLVDTYGGIVILQKYQKRQEPDHRTYVGKGKLEEIIFEMQRLGANTLII